MQEQIRSEPIFDHCALSAMAVCLTLCASLLTGCTPHQSAEPWSTKSQSATTANTAAPKNIAPKKSSSASTPPNLALHARADAVLREAAASDDAQTRAHAIEGSIRQPALLRELAPKGLVDPNRGVRFVACMAIGETRLKEFAHLVQPLLTDESASVRAAAILTLTRLGETVDPSPLGAMAASEDLEARANAYLVLGLLGNKSAVPLIRASLGNASALANPIRIRLVDLQGAEALVRLGETREIDSIRAAVFSPPEQEELAVVACEALGRLRDEVSAPMLRNILAPNAGRKRAPEVCLAAASALLALGAPTEPIVSIARAYVSDPDPRVRAQAAVLLGKTANAESMNYLNVLRVDSNSTVRLCASAASLSPVGIAE